MAHLLAPQNSLPTLPVFFNVDKVVGNNPAINLREDVLLVQFAFTVIASQPEPSSGAEFNAAAAAVRATGHIDQATITAIMAAQNEVRKKGGGAGTIVDGRVSPATGGYAYGAGTWTIVHLNESMQGRHINIWPRIDLIPGCPNELKAMVVRTVQGT
ncbi:MAG: hypothetical protein AB7V18_10720 [Pyrinomonadaceae bacterium]